MQLTAHIRQIDKNTYFFEVSNKVSFKFNLYRRQSRRISAFVNETGVRVYTASHASFHAIEQFLLEHQNYVINALNTYQQSTILNQWELGKTVRLLGTDIRLTAHYAQGQPLFLGNPFAPRENDALLLNHRLNTAEIQKQGQQWFKKIALQLFKDRLDLLSQYTDKKYKSVHLSSATTLWGSCNARGEIRLNWRLLHLPLKQIDYIVAHELAHLSHMNHKPEFWAKVYSIMPDYEEHKKAIKKTSITSLV